MKTKPTPPTQTFAERISDVNKSPLAPGFISAVRSIASDNAQTEDYIWQKWQEYSEYCRRADQSAVLGEFCDWNKFRFKN